MIPDPEVVDPAVKTGEVPAEKRFPSHLVERVRARQSAVTALMAVMRGEEEAQVSPAQSAGNSAGWECGGSVRLRFDAW